MLLRFAQESEAQDAKIELVYQEPLCCPILFHYVIAWPKCHMLPAETQLFFGWARVSGAVEVEKQALFGTSVPCVA